MQCASGFIGRIYVFPYFDLTPQASQHTTWSVLSVSNSELYVKQVTEYNTEIKVNGQYDALFVSYYLVMSLPRLRLSQPVTASISIILSY